MSHADRPGAVTTAADALLDGFASMLDDFLQITQRARARFEARDWHGCEADAGSRLDVYPHAVARMLATLEPILDPRFDDRTLWARIKREFASRLEDEPNAELARTFFNSVTREIFVIEGIDPQIEFASLAPDYDGREPNPRMLRRYSTRDGSLAALRGILEDFRFDAAYRDLEWDCLEAARRLDARLATLGPCTPGDSIEMFDSVFYRMKHAYLIGRLRVDGRWHPLILPLLHDERGIYVDAVLIEEDQASILFSFTRAHFHVLCTVPRELILFLRSILPAKSLAELYNSIGYNRHGKTELYRSLRRSLERSTDEFVHATGEAGMVMLVFTLPSFDLVFKVIRDRFPYPKSTTAREVRERYRLVAKRDRVGRLVEAQSFEHLELPRTRFSAALLEELQREAAACVRFEGDRVTLEQLYTERRVRPLNLYLREAPPQAAARAVIDYGHAIRELAEANIFPGDFLLKNFGVTRHERVVFYDYDELCLLTDCRFRKLPAARFPEDELAVEPWFSVGSDDVFPEEFRRFLGLPAELRELFERHHAELFTPEYWIHLQQRHRAGEILDFFPYPQDLRIRSRA